MSFNTKYAHNVVDIVQFKQRCSELLLEAAVGMGIKITDHNYDRNHVHMDVSWSRMRLSVDQIGKKLKGVTGRKLLREFPAVKKRFFWGSGLWSPVIYCDSLGREPEQIRSYIRNQGRKSKAHEVNLKQLFNNLPKRA
jgi:REP element-mobilizing transposase RayT